MKSIVLSIVAFVLFIPAGQSQNVGIGVPAPTGRLQVNHLGSLESPTLKLYDSSLTSIGGAVLQFTSNNINKFSVKASLANNALPAESYLDYFFNNRIVQSMTGEGRMMIGSETPEGRLLITHRSQDIDPTITIYDSSTQSAGRIKFRNAGGSRYWQMSSEVNNANRNSQYMDFTTDSSAVLTLRGNGRVGIANLSPAYPLDVAGDANFTGAIRVNGNPGTAGQVLTSNGTGDATWGRAALSNNTRFAFTASDGPAITSFLTGFTTVYNTTPADITIGTNTVTFNKAGLYHLEGSVNGRIDYSATPSTTPVLTFYFFLDGSRAVARAVFDQRITSSTLSYTGIGFYSYDSYFTAGQVLQFAPAYSGGSGGGAITLFDTVTYLRGYLISE